MKGCIANAFLRKPLMNPRLQLIIKVDLRTVIEHQIFNRIILFEHDASFSDVGMRRRLPRLLSS